MRVRVYYNLHKHRFSVQYNGRVIDHVDYIVLRNCKFIVRPGGQRKVRDTHRKNVHAFIEGDMYAGQWPTVWDVMDMTEVRYNPYTDCHFTAMADLPFCLSKASIVVGRVLTDRDGVTKVRVMAKVDPDRDAVKP